MKRKLPAILITGGAGFIGSHVVRRFVKRYPGSRIVNLDQLTYAGNLANLRDIEHCKNYLFVKGDICDGALVNQLFSEHRFIGIIHLAAESHVDRSIVNPLDFVSTNILGTVNLLFAAKNIWCNPANHSATYERNIFYHISTDEVYGSLGKKGKFTEKTAYDPRSPYSASKASSDHLARAFFHTYRLPVVISNCSNNYGPYQFPEKLLPLAINNIKNNKPVPVYGKGENIRDWLHVEDHARAIDLIFHKGVPGETYNIGSDNEWKNIKLIRLLCEIMDEKLDRKKGESAKLITFVKDRPGHDIRYAINAAKLQKKLGWRPSIPFRKGLKKTVDWYLASEKWLGNVTSGDYLKYYEEQYVKR